MASRKIDKYAAAGEKVPGDWLIGLDGDKLWDSNRYVEGSEVRSFHWEDGRPGTRDLAIWPRPPSELLAVALSDGDVSRMDCSSDGN